MEWSNLGHIFVTKYYLGLTAQEKGVLSNPWSHCRGLGKGEV